MSGDIDFYWWEIIFDSMWPRADAFVPTTQIEKKSTARKRKVGLKVKYQQLLVDCYLLFLTLTK